jgi:hypothetical protein
MLVKFNPNIGNTDANLIGYNFIRCIDAVITAAASSTPVVNPLTAANTYNTGLNCITSVIANTEAGGWTRSASYNLVDASYSASTMQSSSYRGDYYNASNKSEYPYKKFTVSGQTSYGAYSDAQFMDIRYGIHTDTAYSSVAGYSNDTTSARLTATGYYGIITNGLATKPTLNSTQGTANADGGEWIIAATADYIILINANQSITYCGTRTTQNWETSYSNNPPVVGWYTATCYLNVNTTYQPWSKFGWLLTQDGTGTTRSTPNRIFNWDGGSNSGYNYVNTNNTTIWHGASNVGQANLQLVGNYFGGPIVPQRATSVTMQGSPGVQINPVPDNSGALVPCAIPIWMMTTHSSTVTSYTYYNGGGRCLGIYKSIGGPDSWMNNYYSPGQTFVVDGENYYPFITGTDTLYRDMWLLRKY